MLRREACPTAAGAGVKMFGPGHSFKYIAALQAADPNGAPHLIRIETRAGHGSGKPTAKIIEEASDVTAFLARFTGLDIVGR